MSGGIVVTWLDRREKAAAIRKLARLAEGADAIEWGESVSEAGERELQAAVNRGFGFGGKTIKGGPRIASGLMIGSIGSDTSIASGSVFATAGFGEGGKAAPAWTLWQEFGTSRGIAPMLAVPAAQFAMQNEARDQGDEYLMKTKARWEAIG